MNINNLSIYLHTWLQAKLYVYATKVTDDFSYSFLLSILKCFLENHSVSDLSDSTGPLHQAAVL